MAFRCFHLFLSSFSCSSNYWFCGLLYAGHAIPWDCHLSPIALCLISDTDLFFCLVQIGTRVLQVLAQFLGIFGINSAMANLDCHNIYSTNRCSEQMTTSRRFRCGVLMALGLFMVACDTTDPQTISISGRLSIYFPSMFRERCVQWLSIQLFMRGVVNRGAYSHLLSFSTCLPAVLHLLCDSYCVKTASGLFWISLVCPCTMFPAKIYPLSYFPLISSFLSRIFLVVGCIIPSRSDIFVISDYRECSSIWMCQRTTGRCQMYDVVSRSEAGWVGTTETETRTSVVCEHTCRDHSRSLTFPICTTNWT